MSLDIDLILDGAEVYSRNITHNLGKMADAAGIYWCIWRPDEIGIKNAGQIIEPLAEGLEKLRSDPEKYQEFNPSNMWGSYTGLVEFVEEYLEACKSSPDAKIIVCR